MLLQTNYCPTLSSFRTGAPSTALLQEAVGRPSRELCPPPASLSEATMLTTSASACRHLPASHGTRSPHPALRNTASPPPPLLHAPLFTQLRLSLRCSCGHSIESSPSERKAPLSLLAPNAPITCRSLAGYQLKIHHAIISNKPLNPCQRPSRLESLLWVMAS